MLASVVKNFRARRFDRDHSTRHMIISELRDSVLVKVPVHPDAKERDTDIHAITVARGAIEAVR